MKILWPKLFQKALLVSICSACLFPLGSIANTLIDTDNYQGLASDRRAFRVGEPLLILVVESTQAQSSAGTETSKSMNISANAKDTIGTKAIGLGLSNGEDGSGRTTRRGTASTTLSVTVSEVLAHGLLRLTGEQNLLVNNENQKIMISGIVRTQDISKDNTILSNRLADAKIEILGDGSINEAQRSGIIHSILSWLRLT